MEAQFCVAIPETGRRGCSQITSNDLSLYISILSIYPIYYASKIDRYLYLILALLTKQQSLTKLFVNS